MTLRLWQAAGPGNHLAQIVIGNSTYQRDLPLPVPTLLEVTNRWYAHVYSCACGGCHREII